MPKKRKSLLREYVNHPRYGDKPIYSGSKLHARDIVKAHWQYDQASIFAETAIVANTAIQNYSMYAIEVYVDIEKICRDCHRWFIFFAKEQQYWFEVLNFYVDADCVKCCECRKKDRSVRNLQSDYADLMNVNQRTTKQTKQLKQIALALFELGYINDKRKVDGI